MFGFWYFHRRWRPEWENGSPPLFLAAGVSSAVVAWFSWPLMVVYLLIEYRDYLKAKDERMKEEARNRSKQWGNT
jgi:TRAP-type C4-dicarboxylate transport system permease small subunit